MPRTTNKPGPSAPNALQAAKPGPSAPNALQAAGVERADDGSYVLSDSLGFRSCIEKAMRPAGAKEALLSALGECWASADELRLALQPTRVAGPVAPASEGAWSQGAKDSVVRLLLHCDSLQKELAALLFTLLPEHQDEMEGAGAVRARMPLPKLILSQFRWLERIVDGGALLESLEEVLQVGCWHQADGPPDGWWTAY